MKSVKDFHVRKSIPTSTSRKDTSIVQAWMNLTAPNVLSTYTKLQSCHCEERSPVRLG